MPCERIQRRAGAVRLGGLLVLASVGCGGETFPRAHVSGQVTLAGEPLKGARVGFEPMAAEGQVEAGPGSYGQTDAAGRYQLQAIDGGKGAVVGRHRVWISTYQGQRQPDGWYKTETKERLPPRYNDQTELTFEVPSGGTDAADFHLEAR